MKWYVSKAFSQQRYEFALLHTDHDRLWIAGPVEFDLQEVPPAERGLEKEPTFTLDLDLAQTLMDAMWAEGLRPSSGHGGTAEVQALHKHIEFAERVTSALLERK